MLTEERMVSPADAGEKAPPLKAPDPRMAQLEQYRGSARATKSPILLLTASMGSGHTAVASELARRFRERGCEAEVVDLLEVLPRPLGQSLRSFYAGMLRWAPWIYEGIYQAWFQPRRDRAAPVSPLTWFGERAVEQRVRDQEPAAVISTFHLCSRIIGNLRRAGVLTAPSATVIVDFAVHDLWVDPAVDLHVCLHPSMATEAQRRGAQHATAPGPVVRSRFVQSGWDRQSARTSLGLGDEERAVLVVAGSWGAGEVGRAVEVIAGAPGLMAIVVCGENERLRRRLTSHPALTNRARIMGWVSDMERLMAAADVVVENAGGLTCMEALAAGRPVLSFNPLPGHGRANIEAMVRCGIVDHVLHAEDLVPAIEAIAGPTPRRNRRLEAAAEMFRRDATDDIATALGVSQAASLCS